MGTIAVSTPGNPPQPPYHPTARYNAVLVLGNLDRKYANQASGPQPGVAEPLPQANSALTLIVDGATTSNTFSPPLILAALIGLERHAQFRQSLSPQAVAAMTTAALKLVMHDEPIQQLDAATYAWLRLRAASVLANLGSVGTDNQVYKAILHLVGNLKSLDDRCDAAAMLARLKYEGVKAEGAPTAETLLKLAADIADAELKQAIEFEDRHVSGGMPISSGRMPDRRSSADFATSETKQGYPRRTLVFHLTSLRQAMTNVKPMVATEVQTKFDAVLAAIDPVIRSATDKDAIELEIAAAVRNMSAALKQLAAAPAAVGATPLTAEK
jgi:hypothetical protein